MDSEEKKTILFVDDEESILDVSSEYFRRKGYQTLTARTGAEALEFLASEAIDCCFTDINMPEMNGLELAERIRSHDNTMPVIVMTGYPSLDGAERPAGNPAAQTVCRKFYTEKGGRKQKALRDIKPGVAVQGRRTSCS